MGGYWRGSDVNASVKRIWGIWEIWIRYLSWLQSVCIQYTVWWNSAIFLVCSRHSTFATAAFYYCLLLLDGGDIQCRCRRRWCSFCRKFIRMFKLWTIWLGSIYWNGDDNTMFSYHESSGNMNKRQTYRNTIRISTMWSFIHPLTFQQQQNSSIFLGLRFFFLTIFTLSFSLDTECFCRV